MIAYDGDTMDALQRYAAPRPVYGVPSVVNPTTAAVAAPAPAPAPAPTPFYDPAQVVPVQFTRGGVIGGTYAGTPIALMKPGMAYNGQTFTYDQLQQLRGAAGLPQMTVDDSGLGGAFQNLKDTGAAAIQGWAPAGAALVAGPAGLDVGGLVGGGTAGAAAQGATAGALATTAEGGTPKQIATGALVGGAGGAAIDTISGAVGTPTTSTAPTTGSSPTLLADAGTTMTDVPATATGPQMPAAVPPADPTFGGALTQTGTGQFENLGNINAFGSSLAPTTASTASAPKMPAAVPEADPTFGGALTQTAPGVFSSPLATATPVSAPANVESTSLAADTSTPTAPTTGTMMPAAVPEADPTFGGALTNTGGDVFQSPITTSVSSPTVTGNDTTGSDTITPTAGGVGSDGSADTNTNTGGSDTGSATQSTGGLTGTTGTSSDTGTGVGLDGSADMNTNTGGSDTVAVTTGGTGGDTTDSTSGTGAFDVAGSRADPSSPDSGATIFGGSGGTGGGGDGLGSDFVDNSETGAFDQGGSRGVFDNQGNPLYESPGPGISGKDIGDVITKYGPLTLGVAGIMNQRSAAKDAAAKIGQVGSQQREIATDLLNKYKSGELNAADKLAIDEWQRGAIAQVRQYYANAHQSDSSAAVDAEARVNARAEAMKEAARQGLLKMGLDALNVTDRYQAAAANAEYGADQQMLANAINFMNAYGSWLRGSPKSGTAGAGRGTDVAAATGTIAGPDMSVPDYGGVPSDYNQPG